MELLLVDDVTVLPENATIYDHPDVKVGAVWNRVGGESSRLLKLTV